MPVIHLYDNTIGPPTNTAEYSQVNMGVAFHIDTDGQIEGLRAYINGGGPFYNAWSPKYLSLWDVSTGTRVDTLGALSGATALGWADYLFATPYPVYAGETYRIAWEPGVATAPWYLPQIASSSLATPPTGLSWASTPAVQQGSPTDPPGYPASSATLATWCDVLFNTDQVSAAGLNPRSLDNGLSDWLVSTVENAHQSDGLPWLTKGVVDTTKANLDTYYTTLHNSLIAVANITGNNGSAVGYLLKDFLAYFADKAALTQAQLDDLMSRIVGTGSGGGGAFYGPSGTQVAAGVETLLAQNTEERIREQLQLTPDPASDVRWTTTTTTGTGWAHVADGADMYRLTITTPGTDAPHVALPGGIDWYPRIGWWAPVRDGFTGPRGFIEFAKADLRWPPHRMNGCLLYVGPGVEWSIDAMVLDA